MGSRWRVRRLGLRNRLAAGFALMALLLSAVLAGATWAVVSTYLNHQRESSAAAQTVDNADFVRLQLSEGEQPGAGLVDALRYPDGTVAVLVVGGRSYASRPSALTVPATLVRSVTGGRTESQRVDINGNDYLVVGVPLEGQAAFFELHPLSDLAASLRVLWVALFGAAIGTTLLGLAIGWVVSRRLLRPIERVTETAGRIAAGDLSARLPADAEQDPDLVDLARSFNRTADALERRVRADARFAGDVSHELRTPLTTMINSLALVENRRADLPAAVIEPLGMLHEDLGRFRRLVVDLIEISRDDGGDGHPGEQVQVADLVRRAADSAAGRPVTVVEDGAASVVMVADKRRLERMVANLVCNADEHGRGCTAVRVTADSDQVRIEVDDQGPGIPADQRDRIFDRFARGGGHSEGVGLGLAIVARHAEWHGGSVSVEDAPGGGARFVVVLPVVAGGARAHLGSTASLP